MRGLLTPVRYQVAASLSSRGDGMREPQHHAEKESLLAFIWAHTQHLFAREGGVIIEMVPL